MILIVNNLKLLNIKKRLLLVDGMNTMSIKTIKKY